MERARRQLYNVRAVKRLLTVAIGVAIAACGTRAAAADAIVVQDAPVPGGTAAFAAAVGIDPAPDRARFMFELTRLIYDNPELRNPAVASFLAALNPGDRRSRMPAAIIPNAGAPELVPVPLAADVWGRAIFHRRVTKDDLVAAIVSDRVAAFICHGLTTLDDETLAYLADHDGLLTRLAERSAPLFAAFASSLHITGNRIVPPGGDAAAPLWEAVVGEKLARPEHFVTLLYESNDGRLAYLFDLTAQLDPARRAYALGMWMPDPAVRLERFRALATTGLNAYHDWHVRSLPFNRPSHDPAMALMRLSVDDSGAPRPPAARGFWTHAFAGIDLPDAPARLLRGMDEAPLDAASLLEAIGPSDVRQRTERLDQLAVGQRLFGGIDPTEALVPIRAVARFRMLMLSLERMGLTDPALYTATARHAARLSPIDGHRGFIAQAQFQGALALVARMVEVRTIDAAAAGALVERLAAAPVADGRYAGSIAIWLRDALLPRIRAADTIEDTLIAALAGPASGEAGPPAQITWEGHPYRLDLGAGERRRLRDVRDRQGGVPIDVAMDLLGAAHRLGAESLAADDLESIGVRLSRLVAELPGHTRLDDEDNQPVGLGVVREAHATLQRALDELTRAARARDVKRAARVADSLLGLTDELLGQSLLSLAYAVRAGDADGALLLAEDVSRRHDFGFGAKDADMRTRMAWTLPRQEVAPATPWHVSGSLLGLDVALAPSALRRVSFERALQAPKLTSNERDALAVSVSMLNPFALTDAQRDRIADAIAAGLARASRLASDADVDAAATLLSIDGGRRRALRWAAAHDRERVPSLLSAAELLVLGGGRPSDFDAWGMTMLPTVGCLCSRVMPPGRWPLIVGRPQLGITGTGVADVNLFVAVRLKELNLPAPLARVVLAAAMQDVIDDVRPTDDADWLALARRARTITREQVEDYLAAATANGPLVPVTIAQEQR